MDNSKSFFLIIIAYSLIVYSFLFLILDWGSYNAQWLRKVYFYSRYDVISKNKALNFFVECETGDFECHALCPDSKPQ